MPERVLSWTSLGPAAEASGETKSVDLDGVAVQIGFGRAPATAPAEAGSKAFGPAHGYAFDRGSCVALSGHPGSEHTAGGAIATFDFTATDPAFGAEVENVCFRIAADDGRGGLPGSHAELASVRAFDATGKAVPVTVTPGTGVLRSGDLLTGAQDDGGAGPASASTLVEIPGPVARIEIDDADGTGGAQGITLSDMHFSTLPPCANANGFVEGTKGDDLIDVAYTGDRHGDVIDGGDNKFPFLGPDDDIVKARAGDDTVLAGEGNDIVVGGRGDDVLHGESGHDLLFGGAGDDTLSGGSGADILSGGHGRDVFRDITDGDKIFGGFGGDDFDTLDLTGAGPLRVVDTRPDKDGNGLDGRVEFLDGDGAVAGSAKFWNIEKVIPCFTPGTVIATPRGERLVEDLKAGDRVITRDNGIQEIAWIGTQTLTGHQIARMPHLRPILIEAGALGNGLPERDLLVSPNHRVLVANDKTTLYFDEREVLAAAKHLTGLSGVQEVGTLGVTYLHFMFEHHEVVLSNGAWTESFQPGDYTLKGIGNAQRNEILELFPELATNSADGDFRAARRTLKKHEARLLQD